MSAEIFKDAVPLPAQRAWVPTPTPHLLARILSREPLALVTTGRTCDDLIGVLVANERIQGIVVEVRTRRARPTFQVVCYRSHRPAVHATEITDNVIVIMSS